MSPRRLSLVIVLPILFSADCGGDAKESSPGEVIARDSALAEDLRVASDTSAFSEAADVAMADEPDTLPRLARARVAAASSSGSVAAAPPTRQAAPATPQIPAAEPPKITRQEAASMPSAARLPDLRRPAPTTTRPVARPAASPTPANQVCASPATGDQRRCLMMHLARSDAALDHNYQAVIVALKRQAGSKLGDKEPESVRRLRVAQRAWLVYRDDECRRRNRGKEGPLWAPMRAECLGQFSEYRAEELAQTLTRLTP